MSRPLRIEFSGALYHVTARGNAGNPIYLNASDHLLFLDVLAQASERYRWIIHAYCLMTNHYHLLLETPAANLSIGMRHLNGVYAQKFNYRHCRVGHMFQGRYKTILVQKDSYLAEVSRYIVLNPVRAGLVEQCEDWPWSSYHFSRGARLAPSWLAIDPVLKLFGTEREQAIHRYEDFVRRGVGKDLWGDIKQMIYLGSDDFVRKSQAEVARPELLQEVPHRQKQPAVQTLAWYVEQSGKNRNEAIQQAFRSGGFSMTELARYFGLHYSTVSRIVTRTKPC